MIECLYGIGMGLYIWHFSDAKSLPIRLIGGILWPLFLLCEFVEAEQAA